jgi:copper chaperone CopZ
MAETLQLTVTGMTCGGCENAVKFSLKQINGVETVTASHKANVVDVTFDETKVTPAAIRTTIEGLGYGVAP